MGPRHKFSPYNPPWRWVATETTPVATLHFEAASKGRIAAEGLTPWTQGWDSTRRLMPRLLERTARAVVKARRSTKAVDKEVVSHSAMMSVISLGL